MIMCLMMGTDEVSPVWFDLRRVCRNFKKAVEIAVRIHVLPGVNLQFSASKWERVQVAGSFHMIRAGTMPLAFSGLAIDETCATFKLNKLENKVLMSANVVNAAWNPVTAMFSYRIQEAIPDFQPFALQKLERDLECIASTQSLPGPLRAPTPFVVSTCAAPPPNVENVGVDLKRMEITLPWKPIISSLLQEQALIANPLKALALRDIERDPWVNGTTLSRKEEALKIALSSSYCRQTRFSTSFAHSVERRNQERQRQWPDDKGRYDFDATTVPSAHKGMVYYPGWQVMAVDSENLWYQE